MQLNKRAKPDMQCDGNVTIYLKKINGIDFSPSLLSRLCYHSPLLPHLLLLHLLLLLLLLMILLYPLAPIQSPMMKTLREHLCHHAQAYRIASLSFPIAALTSTEKVQPKDQIKNRNPSKLQNLITFSKKLGFYNNGSNVLGAKPVSLRANKPIEDRVRNNS